MRTKNYFILLVVLQLSIIVTAQDLNTDIRANQLGYLPNAIKLAAVISTPSDSFKVMTTDLQTTVFKGQFLPASYYSSSGEDVSIADFTLMRDPGEYVLVVDGLGKSYPFTVSESVLTDLSKASLKYYYFNRASMPILSEYGGVWAREEGHPDTAVVVLPSAATASRPAGTIISTPGGWYDAGDYNKYIVSSGGTMFDILSAYETYPDYYDTLDLNIPESDNAIPDILDEALWNIKWMMTMQDEDGGVYNKTTEANFSGFNMPSEVNSTRYVTAKSTAATLDFAAVMAMTARIYKKYDEDLADTALAQALRAWDWAKAHPNVEFTNPGAASGYPAVNTGEYGDAGFTDEFSWSAAELYITTKDSNYYKAIDFEQSFGVPGWPTVGTLSLVSLLIHQDSLTGIADIDMIKSKFLTLVSNTKNNIPTSPYRIPGDFFYWSGNNAFSNWGMLFMQAFRLTGDASYYNAAIASLDYLLGKNATTYSFVTGFGSKTPMNPHHRISVADGVSAPVPGMLVGGPNSGDAADCGASSYPSDYSARSYLDQVCSYSTNEVAIGINSVLAFITGGIQAEYYMNFTDSMPRYFSISTNRINLTYRTSSGAVLVLEGNTDWELMPSEDWITISSLSGSGNGTVQINSKTDNPTDEERSAKIYVYSQTVLTDSVAVTQNGRRKSFRIEAEDYIDKSGTQTEATADEGGGENIGYIDEGDWLSYSLDVTDSGAYNMTIRHAGWAGNFDISINDEFLNNVILPATADWQVWESDTTEFVLPEGQHILKLSSNAVGTNLNWYQFDWKESLNPPVNGLDHSGQNQIHVFPNPAKYEVNLQFGPQTDNCIIEIITLDGKTLLRQHSTGKGTEKIDVATLRQGIYILKINTSSNTSAQKLIIE